MAEVLLCAYCQNPTEFVTGRVIYPHRRDLWGKKFYHCAPCKAYVGVHPGTDRPLGRVANAALRRAKMAAHGAFDALWREGYMGRSQAYAWLSETLGVPSQECHIGLFDEARCAEVVRACRKFLAG